MDVLEPEPGPGQLRIRVNACAVCRTDLHVAEGELPTRRKGVVLGHEAVGRVDRLGPGVQGVALGERVGVAWLHGTCGACPYCTRQSENLCERAEFTGYSVDGGFAECMLARAEFVYPIASALSDDQAAPLLCAGIIGYRPLRRTDFSLLYGERTIRSVANNTREDGRAFLDEAARVQVRTHVEHFPFEAANDALIALKGRGVRGAAILDVAPS